MVKTALKTGIDDELKGQLNDVISAVVTEVQVATTPEDTEPEDDTPDPEAEDRNVRQDAVCLRVVFRSDPVFPQEYREEVPGHCLHNDHAGLQCRVAVGALGSSRLGTRGSPLQTLILSLPQSSNWKQPLVVLALAVGSGAGSSSARACSGGEWWPHPLPLVFQHHWITRTA